MVCPQKKYRSLEISEGSCLIDWTEECLLQSKMLSCWYLIICTCATKFQHPEYGFLTCPCALVTSCPVAPCRLDKVFPNTWDPAMDPMAAAAATWLASGFSCWGREIINQTHNSKNIKQKPHTPPPIATVRPEQANCNQVRAVQWKPKCCLSFSSLRSVLQKPDGKRR